MMGAHHTRLLLCTDAEQHSPARLVHSVCPATLPTMTHPASLWAACAAGVTRGPTRAARLRADTRQRDKDTALANPGEATWTHQSRAARGVVVTGVVISNRRQGGD